MSDVEGQSSTPDDGDTTPDPYLFSQLDVSQEFQSVVEAFQVFKLAGNANTLAFLSACSDKYGVEAVFTQIINGEIPVDWRVVPYSTPRLMM